MGFSSHVLRWSRRNLFLKPFDTVMTLTFVPLLVWCVWSFTAWVIASDWSVITGSIKVLMTGVFPPEQLWRAKVAGVLLLVLFGIAVAAARPAAGRKSVVDASLVIATAFAVATLWGGFVWLVGGSVCAIAAWVAVSRSAFAMRHLGRICALIFVAIMMVILPVDSSKWGGLLLSVLLTLIAGALTVPLGILLAFGRRSSVASVRIISTGYIELLRAVPLILVVYLLWTALPLIWPSSGFSDLARGIAGFVLFYSASAAEYFRSGLQAVPRGQIEAAQALGYSDTDIKIRIVLPQAMRIALPGLVGNVLDIFNFAPLVFIIGLTDFLRAGQMILANPQNSGLTMQVYVYLFAVYYVIGSAITWLARRIENQVSRKGVK